MIAIILGTRPEIIKMSPIIRECEKRHLDYFVIHTGQHYSYDMDKIFFEELKLPDVKYNLEVGSSSHGEQTGKILTYVEKVLMKYQTDINLVLVQGDTNSVLAGVLAASKLHIKVGHVEAGLRSFDRSMPEEINRVVADHISNFLFVPTEVSRRNLLNEGIDNSQIFVTGNTVVDAVHQNMEISIKKVNILDEMGLKPNQYILLTVHRAENVDREDKLKGIFDGVRAINAVVNIPIVFPIHPRTRKMVNKFGISITDIDVINPVGYLEFLQLQSNAKLVLTDSGGLQEESCILETPCVTLRENTERPETLDVDANILAGTNADKIFNSSIIMLKSRKKWKSPFGDGRSAERIITLLLDKGII